MAVKVVLLLLVASLAFSVAVAARDLSESKDIPAKIAVPDHTKLVHSVHAQGYQYYRYNGTAWAQFNATARLYNEHHKQVGRHYFLAKPDAHGGQPTWESVPSKTNGGVLFSSVTCKSVSTVTVATDSIPWLLLDTTQSSGSELWFGDVAFVQRVNTKDGLAPTSTDGARVGDEKKMPYTSDYLFYVSETQH